MKLQYKILIALFCASIIGSLAWSANHYHEKYIKAEKSLSEAIAERDSTAAITQTVINTVALFNDITKVNEHAKQKNANDSEQVRVVYKTVLAKSTCAHDLVSGNVANGLYNRANKIRSGASGDTSG